MSISIERRAEGDRHLFPKYEAIAPDILNTGEKRGRLNAAYMDLSVALCYR